MSRETFWAIRRRELAKHNAPQAAPNPEPEPEPEAEPETEYVGWTVADLRAELEDRDLDTDGLKAELIARLEEDDGAPGG